jgi:hypothetical protein
MCASNACVLGARARKPSGAKVKTVTVTVISLSLSLSLSTFGNDCILSSFFSFILTSNEVGILRICLIL